MEGEIAGTSQSKVLTNTSSLLLIALLFLVLASVLKPAGGGGGEERWRFSWGKALVCPKSTAAQGSRPPPRGKPRRPGAAQLSSHAEVLGGESAEMGCRHAEEFAE